MVAPLDVGWRQAASGSYVIAINTSSAARPGQTISLTGVGSAATATVFGEARSLPISGGKLVDDFDAYAPHVYIIP